MRTDRRKDRRTNRQADRQADRQIDRQTEGETDRHHGEEYIFAFRNFANVPKKENTILVY